MRKLTTILIIVLMSVSAFASFEFQGAIASDIATGGSNLVLKDPSALFNNAAMMAYMENTHLTFSTSRLYGMEALTNTSASYIKDFGKLTMGMNLVRFGSDIYSEQQIQIAGAFNVGSNFALGFKGKYMSVVIDEIGSASTLSLDVGMAMYVNNDLYFGARLGNISQPYIGQQYMARDLGLGAFYSPFDEIELYFNVIMNIPASFLKYTYGLGDLPEADQEAIEDAVGDFTDYDSYLENFGAKRDLYAEYHFGMKYLLSDTFSIFGGLEYLYTERISYSAGLAIYGGGMELSYALKIHPELGATHYFSLGLGEREIEPELSVINGRINVNRATAEELSAIPGIGVKTGQRIVDYREANGPFQRIEDLQNVSRIGPKTVEKIRMFITVGGSKAAVSSKNIGGGSSDSSYTAPSSKSAYSGELIDINSADSTTLQKLPRVGPKTAQNILDYRKQNGGFKNKEDIMNVPRIGPKTFANMKDMITVGDYDPAVDGN